VFKQIVKHPKFDEEIGDYDFAIMKLSEPAQVSSSADLVCLPFDSRSYVGKRLTISGWGRIIHEG
jgi:hypothetical protein